MEGMSSGRNRRMTVTNADDLDSLLDDLRQTTTDPNVQQDQGSWNQEVVPEEWLQPQPQELVRPSRGRMSAVWTPPVNSVFLPSITLTPFKLLKLKTVCLFYQGHRECRTSRRLLKRKIHNLSLRLYLRCSLQYVSCFCKQKKQSAIELSSYFVRAVIFHLLWFFHLQTCSTSRVQTLTCCMTP